MDNPPPRRYHSPIIASERTQRQIDRLLHEAEEAITKEEWSTVVSRARAVLRLDPQNSDALSYLAAADRELGILAAEPLRSSGSLVVQPTAFANGRYDVKKFLGEGGKKKVYLGHDTLLDCEVAFASIKTDGLDEISRTRIQREAQAIAGLHLHIVTGFDLGQHRASPTWSPDGGTKTCVSVQT